MILACALYIIIRRSKQLTLTEPDLEATIVSLDETSS
jgi:hypothetical protein